MTLFVLFFRDVYSASWPIEGSGCDTWQWKTCDLLSTTPFFEESRCGRGHPIPKPFTNTANTTQHLVLSLLIINNCLVMRNHLFVLGCLASNQVFGFSLSSHHLLVLSDWCQICRLELQHCSSNFALISTAISIANHCLVLFFHICFKCFWNSLGQNNRFK